MVAREFASTGARRLAEVVALDRIATRLSHARSMKSMARVATLEVCRLLGFEVGFTALRDERTDSMRMLHSVGFTEKCAEFIGRQPVDSTPVGQAIRARKTVVVSDASKSAVSTAPHPCEGLRLGAYVAVPLAVGGRVFGAFVGCHSGPREHTRDELRFLDAACAQLAIAIDGLIQYEAERRRARTLRLVQQIGTRAARAKGIDGLIAGVVSRVRRGFCYDFVSLFLVERGRLIGKASDGVGLPWFAKGGEFPADTGLVRKALRTRASVLVPDVSVEQDYVRGPGADDVTGELVVPLVHGGVALGVIDVQQAAGRRLSEEDRDALSTLCDQVAASVSEARRLSEVSALNRLSSRLVRTRDARTAARVAVREIVKLMRFDMGAAGAYDRRSDRVEFLHVQGYPEDYLRALSGQPLGLTTTGRAIRDRATVLVADGFEAAGEETVRLRKMGRIGSYVVVPLIVGNKVLGTFGAGNHEPRVLAGDELRFLRAACAQLAVAFDSLMHQEAERGRARVQRLIARVGNRASRSLDLDRLLAKVVKDVRGGFGFDYVGVYLKQGDFLVARASTGVIAPWFELGRPFKPEAGLISAACETGESVLSPDVSKDPLYLRGPHDADVAGELVVPLVYRSEVLGVLDVEQTHGRALTEEDRVALVQLADHVSAAVANAKAFSRALEDARVQSALLEVSALVSSTLDSSRVLDIMAEKVSAIIGADVATIYLLDDDGETLYAAATTQSDDRELRLTHRLKVGQGITGKAALERRPFKVDDALRHPDALIIAGGRTTEQSMLVMPLVSMDRLLGVISLDRFAGRTFGDRDLELMRLFAAQTAGAVEAARAHARVLRDASRQAALRELSALVSSTLDPDEVMRIMVERVDALIGVDAATVYVLDGEHLRMAVTTDRVRPEWRRGLVFRLGQGIIGEVAETRTPTRVDDVLRHPHAYFPPGSPHQEKAMIAVPLVARDELLGVIALDRFSGAKFKDDELELLTVFAGQALSAVQSANAHARVLRDAEEQTALRESAESVAASLRIEEVLGRIARRLNDTLAASSSTIYMLSDDGRTLRPIVTTDSENAEEILSFEITVGEGYTGRVARDRRPMLVEDALSDDGGVEIPGTEEKPQSFMAAPLVSGGELLGVIAVNRFDGTAFAQNDLRLLEVFAAQSAVAVRNAQLYERARRRADQMSLIAEVGRRVLTILDPQRLIDQIVRELVDRFGVWAATAFLLTPDEREAEFAATAGGYEGKIAIGQRVPADRGLVGACLSSGKTVYCPDTAADVRFHGSLSPDARTELVVPLKIGDRVIGALDAQMREAFAADPDDVAVLETLAGQLAIAFENSRLYRAEQVRSAHLASVAEVAERATSILELDRLLPEAASTVRRRLGYDYVCFFLMDQDTGEAVFTAADGYEGYRRSEDLRLPPGKGLVGACISTGGTVYCPDVTKSSVYYSKYDRPTRTELVVPLRIGNRVLGALDVHMRTTDAFSDDDVAAAETLAGLLAVAVQNALSYGQARERARRIAATKEIASAVGSSLEFGSILTTVASSLASAMRVDVVCVAQVRDDPERADHTIMLVEEEGRVVQELARSVPVGDSMLGTVIASGDPVIETVWTGKPGVGAADERLAELGVRSLAVVPIFGEACPTGALAVGAREHRQFGDRDMEFLIDVAVHLATALKNARLYDDLRVAYDRLKSAQDQLVQAEKLRALGEMASGVAHDFNNTLAAILGAVQILHARLEDHRFDKWLKIIEKEASDGAETVRRIQEFTRQRAKGEMVQVDLSALLRDVVEVTRLRWETRISGRAPISATLQTDDRTLVLGNPGELKEVFSNLLLNAADAMPEGGAIEIVSRGADDQVSVAVRDSGVGIPLEMRARVFEPFFTTKGPQGSGLGLSVAYGIVKRHGGTITVESEVGKGSTFTVILPLRATDVVETEPACMEQAPPSRVLLVEDEPYVSDVLAEILRSDGHDVVVAGDGESGLSEFVVGRFDVVFSDIAMPGMSGWEVAERIRERDLRVPIVFVTGWGDQIEPERLLRVSVSGVLTKPFVVSSVRRVMSETMGKILQ